MVRSKNVLSVLMQVFMTSRLVALLWAIYGYSIAFTAGSAFFGGFDRLFLSGLTVESLAATFSKGVYVPELAYFVFQLTFACITPALIVGAFAERIKFSAVLAFVVIWFTFAYLPIAHMVWFWAGPDAYTDAEAGAAAGATAGFLFQKGALDFAGGSVVHINAGIAGLVGAYFLGKRVGFGRSSFQPHNLPMVMIGTSLLWVGWFGFNVGSNLEATAWRPRWLPHDPGDAAAAPAWSFANGSPRHPDHAGAAAGAIAGLVAITPVRLVRTDGRDRHRPRRRPGLPLGVTKLKAMLGYDDSLDVFGVHGVGGITGALLTAVFCDPSLGGTGVYDYVANEVAPYSMSAQFIAQLWAVGTTIVWSGVVSVVAFGIVKATIGLRVTEDQEREGLDTVSHGETAYT